MYGKPYNQEMLDLLWALEVCWDLLLDIDQYRKDVGSGDFNTYRMFVKLYGQDAAVRMAAELERYENLFHDRLQQFPAAEQQLYWQCWSTFRQDHPFNGIPDPVLEA